MATGEQMILASLERIEKKVDVFQASMAAMDVRVSKLELERMHGAKAVDDVTDNHGTLAVKVDTNHDLLSKRIDTIERERAGEKGWGDGIRFVWGLLVALPGLIALALRVFWEK